MYICPTCHEKFNTKEDIGKHFLRCWQQHNPNHKSKPAPKGENKIERKIDDNVLDFFASLRERK